ncbi:MAG: response regulator transcription factor [Bacteroidales bacterium]|jgi:DNA-binding NarL/FixJ family response regulator|nr:response regulator transcription factor [Bacteroidales bacterium]
MNKTDKTLKIIIVDDHEFFRNGLKMVVNRLKYASVVGEASNGREFIELQREKQADLVLLDIQMPIMNGIEASEVAIKEFPELKIVILTMFDDEEYIEKMMDIGVHGFLLKNITRDLLDQALQSIAAGNTYYSPELWSYFGKKFSEQKKEEKTDLQFTPRETEILQLICDGLSNKEISEELFISERTVIGHKSNLLAKTNCKSTISLLSFAIKNKLVKI